MSSEDHVKAEKGHPQCPQCSFAASSTLSLLHTDKDNSDQISSLGHQSKNHKTV